MAHHSPIPRPQVHFRGIGPMQVFLVSREFSNPGPGFGRVLCPPWRWNTRSVENSPSFWLTTKSRQATIKHLFKEFVSPRTARTSCRELECILDPPADLFGSSAIDGHHTLGFCVVLKKRQSDLERLPLVYERGFDETTEPTTVL